MNIKGSNEMTEMMEIDYSPESDFHAEIRNQLEIHMRLEQTKNLQNSLTTVYTDLSSSLTNLKQNEFAILNLRNNQNFCHVFLKTVEYLVKTKSSDEHVRTITIGFHFH
jgi:hypothetical protein